MSTVQIFLLTAFCWLIGLLYFWRVYLFVRTRTDRVTFTLFPWSKTLQIEQGGAAHWLLRAVHFLSSTLYLVVGVPITLVFMAMTAFMLFKQLTQG